MFKSPAPHVTHSSPRRDSAHSLFKPLGRASQTSLLDVSTAEEPLPRAAECAVHLELLEVFHTVKSRCAKSHIVAHALNLRQPYSFGVVTKRKRSARAQAAWNTYLTLAVLRFGKWWDAVLKILDTPDGAVPQITKKTLPPLDVLMVWHTYLLTPRKYEARCRANDNQSLLQMEFPWKAVHRAIDASTNTYQLTAEAQDVFQQKTGLEADLLASLQRDKIHDTLTRTFLEKLAHSHLPDTTTSSSQQQQQQQQQPQPFSLASLGVQPYEYTPLLQAYEAHHAALSFLLPAIHRQETFWEKMATLNWVRSPAAARTLHHAVLRYHRFLLLFARHPDTTLVPTLHIDIAWHTALCSPARYAAASRAFAGRFINHDDTIDDTARGDAWRDTQALYKQAFGEEYDVCRCWWCEVWLEEKEAAGADVDDDERISERAAARLERAMQAEKARMKSVRR